MYNKKVLSEATKNLDRTKAPAKKKDIITDPMGQWNHPGKDTRIPGNDITMEGVPYPVWAVPNVGVPQMMYPGMDYKFPEADYVDEFPQNEDYYEDELTDDEIAELKAGGYIVEDISVPQLTQAQFGTATVPTQEEAQFAQRSTKGIPYADKEITLPEVTVTPAGYKGPTNLNNPNALLSPQQRTLAQGKGPLQTGKVNSYNKPLSDKQWKRQQAKDKLIRSGVAAEMYPGYMDQDLMGIQEPFELGEIMDYDADINQNAEDARYRIWKRNEERAYQNAGYGDRTLNELQSFVANPVQQVTRALTGKRSLMGQGYRDIAGEEYDDTRFYDRSKTGLESTMGLTGEIFNWFNPMHYGAKAGHRLNQGRYLDAAGNIGQGVLAGMGSGLAKGALPLMSKVAGATGENLFKAQMIGQSMYDTPSVIGDWFDPNVSFGEAAINTGLTALGYRGAKPGFKSLGQDIKALAPVRQTIPQLSYKKGGEKKFSRSLEAKNKLFAENVFLKKKKSKKRKIFDPNAKYYQDGGIPYNYNPLVSNEPEGVEMPMSFDPKRTTNDPEDYQQFLDYSTTAPENRRPYENYFYGNPNEYDHYGMWDALGKPKNFNQALEMNPWWEPDPYDKMYHGFSVNPNTGVFLKSGKPGLKEGDTTWMEIAGHYLSPRAQMDTPVFDTDLQRFKYIPNRKKGGFQDDLGKHRKLIRDWTYGQSIGMLQEKQLGGQQYRYKGRADAVYTKDTKGNWLIKSPGTKMQWQLVDDPTGKRTTLLNKQAIPLDNTEKVGMNEAMMSKVHADRYANKIKNLRNEVNVYNNALKYEPQFDVPVSESTRVDSSLLPVSVQREKQDIALQKRTKAERIKSIEAYLKVEQQKQNQAAWDRSPAGKAAAEYQAKLDWERRSSGRAQPADWFWTLPLAAAKAPQIATALVEANALTDIPLTIAGAARPGLTVGNAMRAYTVGTSVAGLPQAFTDLNSAKSSDEKIAATRNLVHRIIGSTPVLKWENSIYNTFSTPLNFADNTRKYFSGEELNPITTGSNILRTAAALTGRKEGGEMYEDEIDDETRKQLEALGYIIEDLD